MTDNIKVIVRVRPFNQNQIGQTNIVSMNGQQVRLKAGENEEERKFAFHRCYWSTDNSQGRTAVNNDFVFNDIGKEVLNHIYQGYNSTIFAYGQTGSGKSYSIEGYEQKGLLQMCLQDIFKKKAQVQSQANGMVISVKVTYLQIYNQKLRDLLDPKANKQLVVQSAGNVVTIRGVDAIHCNSFEQVQKLWKDGKKIRVIGAHAMNKNSSRSHAVFTIYYSQAGKGKLIKSKFNIVDLAGSQRQSKTQATGVRLQQANNINKSLTNLGIVIQTLAKNCEKKIKDGFVPYRNSLLTHILSESLAGNSKTFMIAAISPAQSNYEETVSTLRFAQRASLISTQTKKNIQTKQVYNRQLLQEVERLKNQLKQLQQAKAKVTTEHTHSHSVDVQYITVMDQQKSKLLQERILKMLSEIQMQKMAKHQLEKKLQQQRAKKIEMEKNRQKALKEAGLSTQQNLKPEDLKLPYIMNISQDPTLAGLLIYHLKQGITSIGNKQDQQNHIKLNSLGINKRHCDIIHKKGMILIIPKNQSKIFINGTLISQQTKLNHLDRIVLGHANTFKLIIPGEKGQLQKTTSTITKYGEFLDDKLNAKTEEAKNTKIFLEQLELRLGRADFSKFLEKFKSFLADIDEANDITVFRYKKFPIENRNLHFRLNIIVDISKHIKNIPELIIKCQNKKSNQIQFVWTEDKFQSRLEDMQQWYSDVDEKANKQHTYVEFDPWFDATDEFMKEKQKIEGMSTKELYEFWSAKHKRNSEKYSAFLNLQGQILKQFKAFSIDDLILQSYGDSELRGQQVFIKQHIPKIDYIKKNQNLKKRAEVYTDSVLQAAKCQQNNTYFNSMKTKYASQDSTKKIPEKVDFDMRKTIDDLSHQNAWMNQKIEQLEYQLKKKTHQLSKYR